MTDIDASPVTDDDRSDDASAAPGDATAYDDTAPDDAPLDGSSFALFEGDEGLLEDRERRAFVALLKHRYVSARTHADEWRAVLDGESRLRSRLNDLFLELHVDHDREVAFKRQARSESTRRPFPTLLHDTAYTREETIVLVYLRMRLRADARPGLDQVVVDRAEIMAHVAGFRPATATDRTRDEGRVRQAIERLTTARVLLRTSDPDRFRVASVVEVLLPLERLAELDAWLRAVTEGGGEPTDGAAPGLQADADVTPSRTDADVDTATGTAVTAPADDADAPAPEDLEDES